MATVTQQREALEASVRTFITQNFTVATSDDEAEERLRNYLESLGFSAEQTSVRVTILADLHRAQLTVLPFRGEGVSFTCDLPAAEGS